MRGSQPANSRAQHRRIARRGPRFLHFLVGRHEADVVDHRSVADRKDQEVLATDRPTSASDPSASPAGARARPDLDTKWCRERRASRAGRRRSAARSVFRRRRPQRRPRRWRRWRTSTRASFAVLLEADSTVAGMDDPGGQVGSEQTRRSRRGACRRSRSSRRRPTPGPARSACRHGESSRSPDRRARPISRRRARDRHAPSGAPHSASR